MPVAHEVVQLLEAAAVGTFGGTDPFDLYIGMEPETPANVVTLYDMGGSSSDTDELDINRPLLQVRVRAKNYSDAIAKHKAIAAVLHNKAARQVGTRLILGITRTVDVQKIGETKGGGHILVSSFQAVVQELGA